VFSVLEYLGATEFPRIRLGIGRPPEGIDPADYVLEDFGEIERTEVDKIIDQAAESAVCLVKDGIERAMALYNRTRV
jgi:PTH1 family peptidyl-tRNA hydrolase